MKVFDGMRERVYKDTVKQIIEDWRQKTFNSHAEKKKNAYKAFLVKSLQVYHKFKKSNSKKSVPRYMQNLKRGSN